VRAVKDGMVVYSGNKNKKNGKTIIIKHALGFYSSYMQNQTLQVQSGDKVKKGQVIATTGKNNFYFEMKKFETPINPIKYLK
jgi:lipoprotein NlpD